ncbi:MAG: hemerythrin domain-containing protein [Bryobacteraceae bacterium]|nr:hemerythrin domain-containing protein [Bryobacteraceae bacterium]
MRRHSSLIPLSHEHQHGLALCTLTERALNADPSAENVSAQAARIVEQFELELRRHFHTEEQIVFPVLSGFTVLQDLVSEFIEEHRRMNAIVERLRKEKEEALVREFAAVLRGHIRKEESRLFEAAQELLSEQELERLGDAIRRHLHLL